MYRSTVFYSVDIHPLLGFHLHNIFYKLFILFSERIFFLAFYHCCKYCKQNFISIFYASTIWEEMKEKYMF